MNSFKRKRGDLGRKMMQVGPREHIKSKNIKICPWSKIVGREGVGSDNVKNVCVNEEKIVAREGATRTVASLTGNRGK